MGGLLKGVGGLFKRSCSELLGDGSRTLQEMLLVSLYISFAFHCMILHSVDLDLRGKSCDSYFS